MNQNMVIVIQEEAHCGLVKPYGIRELDQHSNIGSGNDLLLDGVVWNIHPMK